MLEPKKCRECKKEFAPSQRTQVFCSDAHYRKCKNPECGELFEVPRRRLNSNMKTCDTQCSSAYRRTLSLGSKKCKECEASFTPDHFNDTYCKNTHKRICKVCSKSFEVPKSKLSKETPTCSPSCGASYSHNESSKKKRIENNLKKYGVEHTFQRKDIKEKIYLSEGFQKSKFGSDLHKKSMLNKYGVDNGFLMPNANPKSISKSNKEWRESLQKLTGENWEFEKFFEGVGSIDLYSEKNGVKLAVEINPTSTHNSFKHLIACNKRGCTEFPCSAHGKGRGYHQDRVLKLKELHDVDLISIFDWTDKDKIFNIIHSKMKMTENRIGARSCELRRISQKEANSFLKKYHILGGSKKQGFCYGLFYEDELISVSTFSRRKGDSWEAKRLASQPNFQVIGGISKMTKQFKKDADPEEIVAFTELSLGAASFDRDYNSFSKREMQKASKIWSKGNRKVLDKTAAFQSADRLIGIAKNSKESPYPSSMSNEEIFIAERWLPVWDCGKIKDTWMKSE